MMTSGIQVKFNVTFCCTKLSIITSASMLDLVVYVDRRNVTHLTCTQVSLRSSIGIIGRVGKDTKGLAIQQNPGNLSDTIQALPEKTDHDVKPHSYTFISVQYILFHDSLFSVHVCNRACNDCGLLGVIESVSAGEATIRFMKRTGQYFMWPSKPDIQTVPIDELLCRINYKPVAVSKSRFKFEESQSIDSMLENLNDDD